MKGNEFIAFSREEGPFSKCQLSPCLRHCAVPVAWEIRDSPLWSLGGGRSGHRLGTKKDEITAFRQSEAMTCVAAIAPDVSMAMMCVDISAWVSVFA